MNEEEQGGESQTNHSQARDTGFAVAIEPHGEGKPEKGDQVEDGEREQAGLQEVARL